MKLLDFSFLLCYYENTGKGNHVLPLKNIFTLQKGEFL